MRMRAFFRLLFAFVFLMSVSCAPNAEPSAGGGETEENLKREFCVVDSLQEDFLVLKNVYDELYHVDLSFRGEYKEGDKVVLLYRERELVSEGVYAADTYAVYIDEDELLKPAK